jgi:hypothetical protein
LLSAISDLEEDLVKEREQGRKTLDEAQKKADRGWSWLTRIDDIANQVRRTGRIEREEGRGRGSKSRQRTGLG